MCAEHARKSPVVKARIARWMNAFLSNFMREAGSGKREAGSGKREAGKRLSPDGFPTLELGQRFVNNVLMAVKSWFSSTIGLVM